MKKHLFSILFAAIATVAFAQNPPPAKPQSKPIVLVGGTAHLGNGQVIQNAVVAFDKGILTAVGDASTPYDKASAEVIDVTGKHVYPGLISPSSTLGLTEIGAVRSTNDQSETGGINPNVRALIAYNTDSEVIPTVRGFGVLLTQAAPEGSVVTGCSSIMELDGWNWEDAVHKKDDGIHINWPSFFTFAGFDEGPVTIKRNEKRDEVLAELDRTFNDAMAYQPLKTPEVSNLRLAAMRGLFDGTMNLYVHANYGKEIIESVQFAKAHGVKKVVIIGGEQAYTVVDFLKENKVPVILGALHRLPARPEEDVDMPYKQPALLHKAGVLVGLSYEGEYWRTRNLPFQAGTAAAYGLTKEEALQLVTANNAKILGLEATVGTLEKGKHATLVVSAGDLLDMRTNQVELAFLHGKRITLDDRQKQLYRKYKEKYGL